MCCNSSAEFVSLLGDGLQFLQRVLSRSRLVAFGKDASGCHDLDHISSVLDDLADSRTRGPRAVGHAVITAVVLERQQVVVGVSTRDAQGRSGSQHPWAD